MVTNGEISSLIQSDDTALSFENIRVPASLLILAARAPAATPDEIALTVPIQFVTPAILLDEVRRG